jgi:thiamine pyrophosphokinase
VVGDLDSIDLETRAWLGEGCLVHRPDQESTDLHKTLAHAFDERGAERVTILAATGGRLDHALENLGLLARWSARGQVEILDAHARIVAVGGEAELATSPGQTVSLVPLGRCERVTTRGLRWRLDGEPLDLAGRTGVSNVAVGDSIALRIEGGHLLVFLAETGSGGEGGRAVSGAPEAG